MQYYADARQPYLHVGAEPAPATLASLFADTHALDTAIFATTYALAAHITTGSPTPAQVAFVHQNWEPFARHWDLLADEITYYELQAPMIPHPNLQFAALAVGEVRWRHQALRQQAARLGFRGM